MDYKNYEVVVFDFDGTIADTMPILENIAVGLLKKHYGISEEFARLGYIQTTGLPFVQQMELLFPNHQLNQEIVQSFETRKLHSVFDQPLFNDTTATLETLNLKGYKTAISSSTIQSTIEEYCKRTKISQNLDLILGYSPGFEKGRPHFSKIVQFFQTGNDKVLFIGDSLKDAERALTSHVGFIGKLGMFSSNEFERIIPNCRTIKDLCELVDII